jgi:hypothetical protein
LQAPGLDGTAAAGAPAEATAATANVNTNDVSAISFFPHISAWIHRGRVGAVRW